MDLHQAEHEAHEFSAYSNEFEAAYDQSRIEFGRKHDDSKEIAALIAKGRHVLFLSHPVFCRYTDACLGEDQVLLSDYATREEALTAYDAGLLGGYSEEDLQVLPFCIPADSFRSVSDDDDTIPF